MTQGNEWVKRSESPVLIWENRTCCLASCRVADELSPTDQRAVQMSGSGGSGPRIANAGEGLF